LIFRRKTKDERLISFVLRLSSFVSAMLDSSPEIRVRRASLADLETVILFNLAMARETEGKKLEQTRLRAGVEAALQREDLGFYLVAEIAGEVVGQLLITTEWSDWRNGYFWWVQSVYVAPEHRRRGVYRALHNHVRQEALSRQNICGVRLYVDRDNHVAQQVYRSLGMSHSHYDLYEVEFG
jgi:GNAT superfamily N-acetyltransferase